jgi:hypothetical protein
LVFGLGFLSQLVFEKMNWFTRKIFCDSDALFKNHLAFAWEGHRLEPKKNPAARKPQNTPKTIATLLRGKRRQLKPPPPLLR